MAEWFDRKTNRTVVDGKQIFPRDCAKAGGRGVRISEPFLETWDSSDSFDSWFQALRRTGMGFEQEVAESAEVEWDSVRSSKATSQKNVLSFSKPSFSASSACSCKSISFQRHESHPSPFVRFARFDEGYGDSLFVHVRCAPIVVPDFS
jgi:hypothetical protein